MNQLRFLLLTALTLLPASGCLGQAREVCNTGRIAVDVAGTVETWGLFSHDWITKGWQTISPGDCEGLVPDAVTMRTGTPKKVYLAFAFTDSTGVWGAVKFKIDYSWLTPSDAQLCVGAKGTRFDAVEVVEGTNPAKGCKALFAPASFEIDNYYFDKFSIAVGPNDRAIPLGRQSSSTTSSNASPKPASGGDSFGTQLLKELAKSIAEAGNKPVSKPDPAATEAERRAAMLKWVREDLTAYIAASATGFEAYKKGDSFMFGAARAWNSKESPLASKGCWVIEGGPNTFSCLLSSSTDLSGLRAYYAELTDAVSASLPQGWRSDATPPFAADLPSKAFRSSSGAYGEVWIVAAAGGRYELRYDLVAAQAYRPAVNPKPASTAPDDDPIGPGGFIKPPDRVR